MKIHLLRSPEVNEETYSNVLQLLQLYRGPLHFISCENKVDFIDDQSQDKTWLTKKDFEKKAQVNYSPRETNLEEKIIFPHIEKTKTWKQLFKECERYRKNEKLATDDIVVLLTDIGNEKNWFGGVSPSMKNYFVQTSNWEHFFGYNIDIRFPIAYEVIIWIMRFYMFPDNESVLKNIHEVPLGCIMDFCQDKSQIILKMRTADVCEKCMSHFTTQDVPVLYTQQFFDILDGIRKSMTFRGRSVLLHKPSAIEVKGHTKQIFFSELGNLELRLNPKEKALFLLFLNHPQGIFLHDLQDHKSELIQLYNCFCRQSEPGLILQAIDNLVNPTDNDKDIILSRINKKIKLAVGESLMDFYAIKGEHGGRKKIKLNRELITYS